MPSKYDISTTEELGSLYSDYHKDCYGFRPRGEGLYSDRAALIAGLESLDRFHAEMRRTFEGREQLRIDGWIVEETEPDLAIIAAANQKARDAERDAWYDMMDKRIYA